MYQSSTELGGGVLYVYLGGRDRMNRLMTPPARKKKSNVYGGEEVVVHRCVRRLMKKQKKQTELEEKSTEAGG
mgnify:CR=1 FL=1